MAPRVLLLLVLLLDVGSVCASSFLDYQSYEGVYEPPTNMIMQAPASASMNITANASTVDVIFGQLADYVVTSWSRTEGRKLLHVLIGQGCSMLIGARDDSSQRLCCIRAVRCHLCLRVGQ